MIISRSKLFEKICIFFEVILTQEKSEENPKKALYTLLNNSISL